MMWEKSRLGQVVRDKRTRFESSIQEYAMQLFALSDADQIIQTQKYLEVFWKVYPTIEKASNEPTPDVIYEALNGILSYPYEDDDIAKLNEKFVKHLKEKALQGKGEPEHAYYLSQILDKKGDTESAKIIKAQFDAACAAVAQEKAEKEQAQAKRVAEAENARQRLEEQRAAAAHRRAEKAAKKKAEKNQQTIVAQGSGTSAEQPADNNETDPATAKNDTPVVSIAPPVEDYDAMVLKAQEYVVKEDYPSAIKLFNQAAQQGHIEACYQLARCFEYGYGTKSHMGCAVFFYVRAAFKKHDLAIKALDRCLNHEGQLLLAKLDKNEPNEYQKIIKETLLAALMPEVMFADEQILKHPTNRAAVIGILRKTQEEILLREDVQNHLGKLIALFQFEFEILGIEVNLELNEQVEVSVSDQEAWLAEAKLVLSQMLKTPEAHDEQILAKLAEYFPVKTTESESRAVLVPFENKRRANLIVHATSLMLLRSIQFFSKSDPQKALPHVNCLIKLLRFNRDVLTWVQFNPLFKQLSLSLNLSFSDEIMIPLNELEMTYNDSLYNFIAIAGKVLREQTSKTIAALYEALVTIVLTDRDLQRTLAPFMFAIVVFQGAQNKQKHPLIAALLTLQPYQLTDHEDWEHTIKHLCKKSPLKEAVQFKTEAELYAFISAAIWTISACRSGYVFASLTAQEREKITKYSNDYTNFVTDVDMKFRKDGNFTADQVTVTNNPVLKYLEGIKTLDATNPALVLALMDAIINSGLPSVNNGSREEVLKHPLNYLTVEKIILDAESYAARLWDALDNNGDITNKETIHAIKRTANMKTAITHLKSKCVTAGASSGLAAEGAASQSRAPSIVVPILIEDKVKAVSLYLFSIFKDMGNQWKDIYTTPTRKRLFIQKTIDKCQLNDWSLDDKQNLVEKFLLRFPLDALGTYHGLLAQELAAKITAQPNGSVSKPTRHAQQSAQSNNNASLQQGNAIPVVAVNAKIEDKVTHSLS